MKTNQPKRYGEGLELKTEWKGKNTDDYNLSAGGKAGPYIRKHTTHSEA